MNIEEIKKINIVDFCNQNGISLIQNSREYYRLKDHDSCVISDKKNIFKWNSKNQGGDIINFVEMYYDCSFKDALKKLQDKEYDVDNTKRDYTRKEFIYNNKEVAVTRGKDYLINVRRIDKDLVENFIEKGLIRQNDKNNILFVWKDNNKIIGCSEQGTKSYFDKVANKEKTFKKIQTNSKEDKGFKVEFGNPKTLYFFESEIDLLSYLTKYPDKKNNATFISMNGLKKNTVFKAVNKHYEAFKELPSINICVDNDKGGNTFYDDEFKDNTIGNDKVGYTRFKRDVPHIAGFDWNDMLVKQSEIINSLNKSDLTRIIKKTVNQSNRIKKKENEIDYN